MIKRLIIVGLSVGLIAGAVGMPAHAKKKKKPKAAAPVATTLFMDGESNFGEEDQIANGTYLKLGPAAGGGAKSMGFYAAATSPNPNCAGNSLVPVFVGPLAGQVVGDIKVTFNAASTPGNTALIRVWPDVAGQMCNEEFPEPAASVEVPLPAGSGTVEAIIPGVNFTAAGVLMLQINSLGVPPGYARINYGTDASKVEFPCVPANGAAACTS